MCVLSCMPPASSDRGVPFVSKSDATPAGPCWGPMALPYMMLAALHGGLSPGQKKRDLCE